MNQNDDIAGATILQICPPSIKTFALFETLEGVRLRPVHLYALRDTPQGRRLSAMLLEDGELVAADDLPCFAKLACDRSDLDEHQIKKFSDLKLST
jgi:hypothetical protein